jgi:hypothetical protein
MTLRDVVCRGTCRHRSAEECATATHLVFPYRGTYVRHVGQDNAVADANQLMLFNRGEGYRVSHPIGGGDASLSLALDEDLLRELVPKEYLRAGERLTFRMQRLRIDPRAQALVSLLRHGLTRTVAEPLQAETLVLTLVRRTLGERTSRPPGSTYGRQRLVDRAKLAISADPARRWKLAEIAAEVGVHSAGRRPAALSIPAALPAGARPGSAARVRRPERAGTGPRLLHPQPLQLRVQAGLRTHARRAAARTAAALIAKVFDSGSGPVEIYLPQANKPQ